MLSTESSDQDIESAASSIEALELKTYEPLQAINQLSDAIVLKTVQALHADLNIQTVIQRFAKEITKALPCDAIAYEHPSTQLRLQIGKADQYRFSYHLQHNNTDLGEIKFQRKNEFAEEEILLIEDYLCLLVSPLRNALVHFEARYCAIHDPLTGLLNRLNLEAALAHDIEIAKRHCTPLSTLMIDIDHFKQLNDEYGHLAGDAYLKRLSQIVQSNLRATDRTFRLGGEEFLILLNETDTKGAVILADRLRQTIESTLCIHDGNTFCTTVSIGIASYLKGDQSEQLFERVDQALYRAKQQGRNQIST